MSSESVIIVPSPSTWYLKMSFTKNVIYISLESSSFINSEQLVDVGKLECFENDYATLIT